MTLRIIVEMKEGMRGGRHRDLDENPVRSSVVYIF